MLNSNKSIATPVSTSAIEKLCACRQAEQEAEDQCCVKEDWLFGKELKQLVEEQVEAEWKRVGVEDSIVVC